MKGYNPNIHHRRSIRLKGYDYAQAGLYFITICCQDRAHFFGEIKNGHMILNEYGEIAVDEWTRTAKLRTNVELREFVIMPNHVHGIIRLLGRGESHSPDNEGVCKTPQCQTNEFNSSLRSPSQTIGSIVRGYKSSVTNQLNLLNIGCVVWQRNYYENIVRDEQSYHRISEYIVNNPSKWAADKFYTK